MNPISTLRQRNATSPVKAFIRHAQNAVKLAFSVTLFISFPLYAYAGLTCAKLVSDQPEMEAVKIFGTLPKRNSAIYSELVQDLKKQIQKTNAYAILDLRTFISELNGLLWANSFPNDVSSQIHQGHLLYSKDGEHFKKEAELWQIEGVANLQTWLRELIEDAVPGAQLGKGYTNVRKSVADDIGLAFDEWHVDGGRASVTLAVEGVGTEVLGGAPLNLLGQQYHWMSGTEWEARCSNCKPMTVPAGYAFIFFGSSSGVSGEFSPTIHRTPREAGSRTLFVIRY